MKYSAKNISLILYHNLGDLEMERLERFALYERGNQLALICLRDTTLREMKEYQKKGYKLVNYLNIDIIKYKG